MSHRLSRRLRSLGLAIVTILLGLAVHFHGAGLLGRATRDVLGDALWAAMIYWLTGVLAPEARVAPRAASALAVCWLVELSQLSDSAVLAAIRRSWAGHLVLGSDFDPRDFLSYAAGVIAAAALDSLGRNRNRGSPPQGPRPAGGG